MIKLDTQVRSLAQNFLFRIEGTRRLSLVHEILEQVGHVPVPASLIRATAR
jgi:hypothetical protein